jgi:hypothetical protein
MDEPYVVVSIVQGQLNEAQVCAFLESNGIPTATRGDILRSTHGISVDGIGAVQILVPSDRAAAARELLARAERGDFRIEDHEDDGR